MNRKTYSYTLVSHLTYTPRLLAANNISENAYISRERHQKCLIKTKNYLESSKKFKNYDVFAEDVRLALNEISKIYGNIDIEDILDIIFNDFCIGK